MFLSDNASGVHPAILEALAEANAERWSPGYGADRFTQAASAKLCDVFETDCAAFLLPSGTAANALALAALAPPWGAVICHRHAHIAEDEAGAPEFYTGGAKLLLIDGPCGKLTPQAIEAEARKYSRAWVHGAQPFAVSITQAAESGAAYSAAAIAAIGESARACGLKLHMDGARFANAAAFTGASPADLTWRAGVDLLSFGATKNGALGVEALIVFDPKGANAAAAQAIPHLRKRAGHMLSKHRFLGAQMAAYLQDDLWLKLAAHANGMARALAESLAAAGAELLHPVEANEVFARLSHAAQARLAAAGIGFYPWREEGQGEEGQVKEGQGGACRFVASFATTPADIARLAAALAAA